MTSLHIHIPKNGGNTIKSALNNEVDRYGHNLRSPNYKFPDQSLNDKYDYIFAFLRNPHSRVVSAYHYLIHPNRNDGDRSDRKKYIGKHSFDEFIRYRLEYTLSQTHFCPQYKFVEKVECDLFPFERLNDSLVYIRQKLNIPFKPVPHKNSSGIEDYRRFYTPDTWKTVEDLYARDFELWNGLNVVGR